MNDVSSSGLPTSPEASPLHNHDASTATAAATADDGGSSREQQKRSAQKAQKIAFLDHLIRNLDIVVFCELSVLYYMDCSLFKFFLRALPHWFFFTPKPDILPPNPTTVHGPYIGTVFGSNLFCILLHLLFAPPAAGEASRGYLHGGFIIDFVGQASPVGRWRLVALDLLCLALQLVMMCLTVEKHVLQGKRRIGGAADRSPLDASRQRAGEAQDLDAEERGMLGSEGATGIEMQDLGRRSRGRTGGDEDRERDELLAQELQEEERDEHPLDVFHTGDYLLVKVHVFDTVRAQWQASGLRADPANAAARTAGMQTPAGDFVGRRITFTWRGRTVGDGRTA